MCNSEENKVAKTERVASIEEEITNGTKMRISVSDVVKDGLEQISYMMDRGFCDESLAGICSWVYLPTQRTSRFTQKSARYKVKAWVILKSYETALDRLTEDAKEVKIMKCEYRSCGFMFFNDRQRKLHFWQMHQGYVNHEMNQIN